jgi:hypothetical protein
MADFLDAAALVEDRLRAAWTATPAARLRFENDPLVDLTDLAPWCQVEIVGGPEKPYLGSVSSRLYRAEGVVMLHFMVPVLDGRAARKAMHGNAKAALVSATWEQDGICIYVGGIAASLRGPAVEDGSYAGFTSAITFVAIYADTP